MFDNISLNPYFRLMRLHDLTGMWLLLWPCLWGLLFASHNLLDALWVPVFIIGAVVMRSAGCIINDIVDINLDKAVERTKNRPLASGELTVKQALLLLGILLLVGFVILLTMGESSLLLGLIAIILVIIYPFTKYYIKYPQIILGIVFNFGALMGWSTIQDKITLIPVLLYIGSVFWTIYYDTIYAHQDTKYDLQVGVNSTALTGVGSKKWLVRFYRLAIIFWACAGVLSGMNISYYLVLALIVLLLYKQLKNIDLSDGKRCMLAFRFNVKIGAMLFVAIFVGKLHVFV